MEHTFLLQKGAWTGKGVYFDENRVFTPLISRVEITHLRDLWLNVGMMKLFLDEEVVIRNSYEIVPFADGSDVTAWKSFNADLGCIHGKFIIVDDTIISVFHSESGQYTGTEHLSQVTETHYRCRGVSFQSGEKQSSWSLELRREA